jgi:hypothetical protein
MNMSKKQYYDTDSIQIFSNEKKKKTTIIQKPIQQPIQQLLINTSGDLIKLF